MDTTVRVVDPVRVGSSRGTNPASVRRPEGHPVVIDSMPVGMDGLDSPSYDNSLRPNVALFAHLLLYGAG